MLRALPAALALAVAAAPAVAAAGPAPLQGDPLLERLVEESLASRPELRQARERARAERERVPQAGALPDPVLSVGIVNDTFDRIMVGEMETSYYQLMLSQGLPWPGKLSLRGEAARRVAEQAEAALERARLGAVADVRRGYLDLLLVRDRLALLGQLEAILQKSAGVARARYEAGEGAQSDVLRAQLELNRLKQRRRALEADERTALQALNRLRARPLDEPIPTTASLRELPVLPPADGGDPFAEAAARSPELRQARLDARIGELGTAIARRELIPDVTITGGIMPRGDFPTMWQAGVSFSLPAWAWRKQARAIEEGKARAAAGTAGAEAVELLLRQRVSERRTALRSLAETVRLYREGLLVQSEATAESTLAQYRVGRVTFASVLEANAGLVGDREGLLLAVADAARIAIAEDEVSLAPTGGGTVAAMGGATVPGAGAASSGSGRSAAGAASSPGGADAGGAPSMSGM